MRLRVLGWALLAGVSALSSALAQAPDQALQWRGVRVGMPFDEARAVLEAEGLKGGRDSSRASFSTDGGNCLGLVRPPCDRVALSLTRIGGVDVVWLVMVKGSTEPTPEERLAQSAVDRLGRPATLELLAQRTGYGQLVYGVNYEWRPRQGTVSLQTRWVTEVGVPSGRTPRVDELRRSALVREYDFVLGNEALYQRGERERADELRRQAPAGPRF